MERLVYRLVRVDPDSEQGWRAYATSVVAFSVTGIAALFALILLTALALFFFGGEVLHGFAFTMVVGIITGTYSSVFIAAAIISFWRGSTARAAAHAPATVAAPAPHHTTRASRSTCV